MSILISSHLSEILHFEWIASFTNKQYKETKLWYFRSQNVNCVWFFLLIFIHNLFTACTSFWTTLVNLKSPHLCLGFFEQIMIIEVRTKFIIAVAMVMILSNIVEINAEPSRGFRRDVGETMQKSRHKIVRTIEVKSPVSWPVWLKTMIRRSIPSVFQLL